MPTGSRRIAILAAVALLAAAGLYAIHLSGSSPSPGQTPPAGAGPVKPSHPLAPAIELARKVQANIEQNVRDYTATMVKRERNDGAVGAREVIAVKIRQKPFSVYVHVLEPAGNKDDEAIYVEGQNDNHLLGHTTGVTGAIVGTISLPPNGVIAMRGQHYPMTEIGILNLCKRLITAGEEDMRHDECEVRFVKDQEVAGRRCTCIEVRHPERREYFRFHLARICVDQERQVPIRYQAFDWPAKPGGEPPLIEEYTYEDLKLNVGLTDKDFDVHNPAYAFP